MQFSNIIKIIVGLSFLSSQDIAAEDWFGYVSNNSNNTITPIDAGPTSPNHFGTPVSLSSDPTLGAYSLAISPDASKAYVINSSDLLTNLSVLDLTNRTMPRLLETIFVAPSTNFQGLPTIAITPDGTKAYITDSSVYPGLVHVITLISNTVLPTPIVVGDAPAGIAITPDGTKAYVINSASQSYSIIDTASNSVEDTILFTSAVSPNNIVITPDGTRALVTDTAGHNLIQITLSNNQQTAIGTPSDFPNPFALAITPDGSAAYVSNILESNIIKIDFTNNNALTVIPAVDNLFAIAITPDSKFAYVTNEITQMLMVLDLSTLIMTPLSDSSLATPIAIAITPDQAPTAAFTTMVAPSGSSTTFDATASSTQTGTIIQYVWDFGDGTAPFVTTSPVTTHVYTTSGTYLVNLTITNSAGTSTTQTFTGQTISNNGGPSAIAAQSISVPPPKGTTFRGRVEKNRFTSQTEYLHILQFEPLSDSSLSGYRLFQDGRLIKVISVNGPFYLKIHNQKPHKRVIYTLVAFDMNNVESSPQIVILN